MFLSTETITFLSQFFKLVSMHFVVGILHPFYFGVLFLIYMLYNRHVFLEENIFGEARIKASELLFKSSMYGILAGFMVSLMVNMLGIHIQINYSVFLYLWGTVILLSLLNLRYLCFSYGGGLLALSNLIFGWPKIDVSGLLAIIALLHLIEAILIWGDGHSHAIPVFVRHKGNVVGAFAMQKYWPIPIAFLTISILLNSEMPKDVTNIMEPNWWPLMKFPDVPENYSLLLTILPIPAALGYSEMVITDSPRNKTKKSGILLAIYSILLLVLAVASSSIYYLKYAAALFAPIAHELLILYWIRREKKGQPYFSVPPQGVRVLEVIEGGPAHQMGIMAGDVILRINGKQVMTRQGIESILDNYPTFIWVDVMREGRKHLTFEYKNFPDGINDLKILVVPRDQNVANVLDPPKSWGLLQKLFLKRFMCKQQ